jgi:hypothetical protein
MSETFDVLVPLGKCSGIAGFNIHPCNMATARFDWPGMQNSSWKKHRHKQQTFSSSNRNKSKGVLERLRTQSNCPSDVSSRR